MDTFCSDEKKRQLYDEYGSFGLYLADQVGCESSVAKIHYSTDTDICTYIIQPDFCILP